MTDDLSLTLTWNHGRGDLAPFFAALEQGRILGARCPVCGRTVVPPRARCTVDGSGMAPLDLPPTGVVQQMTTGAASSLLGAGPAVQTFALVQVTGSDTSLLVRIAEGGGPVTAGTKVRLAPPQGANPHPVQGLVFVADV